MYGCNDGIARKSLWHQLKVFEQTFGLNPRVIGGDFNVIVHPHESSEYDGGVQMITADMREF